MAPNTEVTFYACASKQSHHEVVTEKSVSAVCRWSPDKLMALFFDVVIDLYTLVTFGCFFRNAVTLLYVNWPLEETDK